MPTPEFVLRIREKIGHDLLWMTGVTAVIFDDAGRILLCRRSDNGAWTPITGIVDPGEEPAVTAAREAEEEAGVVVEVEGLASVKSDPPQRFPNGDRVQFMDLTFRCRHVGGEARVNDDESTDVAWAHLEDLPEMNARMLRRIRDAVEFDGVTRFVRAGE
ncbi:NUDIX domain-containing protein [Rothia sp. AR01]|uniref:NUDIX domain-containing protein n=1 Tax=Rothia santali TaxID=2949643 RepID=A0A9X2KJ20_9MICC|nr:NUDIX domain-containing protein [Rothia santali]MCP3426788.1 NUDIX domain-containing protein [Rothia santali]